MIPLSKRGFLKLALSAPLLATPFLASGAGAQEIGLTLPEELQGKKEARRNISSFRRADWREHFSELGQGAIVADTVSRALHFWSGDGATYKLYPTSVPISEDLTKRGYTEVIRKVEGPTWTPTPSMRERDPSLPKVVPAGPDNPLGTHALYLSWQYYRIHGTHDTRKIGRRSSDGCIGLYNEMIADLYPRVALGTQVKLI
ncbi:L,D-transpeptidase [Celeribacter indicus]|uniref:ErfK/YbiS/YcfS/YnhG family protein n=1 Tax=Celeribacter indicus TaxID=1208324 RepID=A0A0B5DYN5_9RHOB|nr:L,D-transpeptidase family protein [Celeribacter indicus]AJE48553.1 ErfK/YbiS/YcfS/YnhG family protein [Celeribacter indicus]SDX08304.1 Lipoprotein-anchoring transpeptidase ErfK/SrfK [Celeribacter indicus]